MDDVVRPAPASARGPTFLIFCSAISTKGVGHDA